MSNENDDNKLEKALISLSQKIKTIQSRREVRLSVTKGRFNLFTILRGIGEEAQLHSKYICYLLNPRADHDCGRTFLDLFIDTLSEVKFVKKNTKEEEQTIVSQINEIKKVKCIEVRPEKVIDDSRRIDIYLEFDGAKIAIENKIWAGEQRDQVSDYAKYLSKYDTRNFLFYLTLWGDESETAGEQKYLIISYEKHIVNWIERCLKETYMYQNINQALLQYKNVIQQLTNQTLEVTEMSEIKEIIRNNPEIIKHQKEIINSIESLKTESIKKFFDGLRDEFNSNKNYNILMDSKIYANGKKWYGFLITHRRFPMLYFYLIIEKDSSFFMIGLYTNAPTPPAQVLLYKSKINELKNLYNEDSFLKDEFRGGMDSAWPAGTFHLNRENNEFVLSILEEDDMKKNVVEVAEKIHKYIDYVGPKIEKILE